jgi:lysophospholipase L1-like esterase
MKMTGKRMVLLGDSITDGGTYGLLIAQALGAAAPVLVNAGIGGDTAAGARARLERDVLAYAPALTSISLGINDTMRDVPEDAYQADMRAIVAALRAADITPVLFTLTPLGPTHAAREASRAAKNAFLRATAAETSAPLVEIDAAMRQAQTDGIAVLEPDEIHISLAGYRVMTRAILDALGAPDAVLPDAFTPPRLPGLVTEWRMRPLPNDAPALTAETVGAVCPDAGWVAMPLPHPTPQADWWPEQERVRGVANDVARVVGPAERYLGCAVHRADAGPAYLQLGGHLAAVWLNGACVYRSDGTFTGWHPGKARVPVHLHAGDNTLVIETGSAFSLQVTPERFW